MKPRAAALTLALALALMAAGCGDDGDAEPTLAGTWDVVLVVGAAEADPGADTSGFPGIGSDFRETWTFECGGDACTLRRAAAPPLGTLDGLRLSADGDAYRGTADGVTAEADVEGESPCAGPTETWTIEMELSRRGDVIAGSAFRIPDALVDGDCYGLDLTLGISGTPAR